jgi:Uma2 family endonuclease
MTTATLVPLAEYLHTSYHPEREWVDGELRERNMGDLPHSSVQAFFTTFFTTRGKQLGLRVYPELRTQVSQRNYRVSDVLVRGRELPAERIITTPPLLCIEILSPDDRMSDIQEKLEDYLAMGVDALWIIDPRRRKAMLVDRDGQRPVTELTLAGYEVRIPLADVFAELDELGA